MNKEQIHDEQISPLMDKIIAICKAHGIAMVASYEIGPDQMRCTTHLSDGEGAFPYEDVCGLVKHGNRPPPLMLTTRDKGGKVTSMTAVLG